MNHFKKPNGVLQLEHRGASEVPSCHGRLKNLDEEHSYWIDEVEGEVPRDLRGPFSATAPDVSISVRKSTATGSMATVSCALLPCTWVRRSEPSTPTRRASHEPSWGYSGKSPPFHQGGHEAREFLNPSISNGLSETGSSLTRFLDQSTVPGKRLYPRRGQ